MMRCLFKYCRIGCEDNGCCANSRLQGATLQRPPSLDGVQGYFFIAKLNGYIAQINAGNNGFLTWPTRGNETKMALQMLPVLQSTSLTFSNLIF